MKAGASSAWLSKKKLLCLMIFFIVAVLVMKNYFTNFNVAPKPQPQSLANLKIKFGVVKNKGSAIECKLTWSNAGDTVLKSNSRVTIHTCFIRAMLGADKADKTTGISTEIAPGVVLQWIIGCYHRIVFSPPFHLEPGESRSVTMNLHYWSIAYTDFMPNWYIQEGDSEPQLIYCTTTEDLESFIEPFDTPMKVHKSGSDLVDPWTADFRADQFSYRAFDAEPSTLHTVPSTDMSVNKAGVTSVIDGSWTLEAPVNEGHTAFWLDNFLVRKGTCTKTKCILLNLDGVRDTLKESYSIEITAETDHVMIKGSEAGLQRAFATILQLTEEFRGSLPEGVIKDSPRFDFRGFMLDVARNYVPVSTVKHILKMMHRYKLNVLHLHLTDDEGWRIQIEGLDELTEIGSRTCFDQSLCILPQLGQKVGPPLYWTKSDYITILKFASNLGIEVFPELDFPAHAQAAIQAMNARYLKDPSVDYRLSDPEDKSIYNTPQFFKTNVINPCLTSTLTFLKKVIATIVSYHKQAGVPLRMVHLGGDEVAGSPWLQSPVCMKLSEQNPGSFVSVKDYFKYFFRQVGEIVASYDTISLGLWEDALMAEHQGSVPFKKSEVFPEKLNVVAFFWQNVWSWRTGSRGYRLANDGYKVVLMPSTDVYFDHPYEPSPWERGFYWATRFSSNKKIFSFRPNSLYDNIESSVDVDGHVLSRQGICGQSDIDCPPITDAGRENILGMQAGLWGETMRTEEHIHAAVFPRLIVFAQRAWNTSAWEANSQSSDEMLKDYSRFAMHMGMKELPTLLSKYGVKYHISPPGARIRLESGQKKVYGVTEFPGERMWYRYSSSNTWLECKSAALDFAEGMFMRASDPSGKLFSHEIQLTVY